MNYNKKSVADIDLKGKKVLLRCDFNVPMATGVEALFGYLYLKGRTARCEELFALLGQNTLSQDQEAQTL